MVDSSVPVSITQQTAIFKNNSRVQSTSIVQTSGLKTRPSFTVNGTELTSFAVCVSLICIDVEVVVWCVCSGNSSSTCQGSHSDSQGHSKQKTDCINLCKNIKRQTKSQHASLHFQSISTHTRPDRTRCFWAWDWISAGRMWAPSESLSKPNSGPIKHTTVLLLLTKLFKIVFGHWKKKLKWKINIKLNTLKTWLH